MNTVAIDNRRPVDTTPGHVPADQLGAVSDLSEEEMEIFRRVTRNMKHEGPEGGDEGINGGLGF